MNRPRYDPFAYLKKSTTPVMLDSFDASRVHPCIKHQTHPPFRPSKHHHHAPAFPHLLTRSSGSLRIGKPNSTSARPFSNTKRDCPAPKRMTGASECSRRV
jgi:hypothetical protein